MEGNPGLTIPRYNDVISPVPWYIVISGFHCRTKPMKDRTSSQSSLNSRRQRGLADGLGNGVLNERMHGVGALTLLSRAVLARPLTRKIQKRLWDESELKDD